MEQKLTSENVDETKTTVNAKVNKKRNKKRLIFISVVICIVIASVLSGVLYVFARPFEYGYLNKGSCLPEYPLKMAYKSKTNVFDINNVNLTISFGYRLNRYDGSDPSYNVPEFDLIFADEKSNCIQVIRHSTENLASSEFMVDLILKNNSVVGNSFNHFEQITIPKELFDRKKGFIYLCIAGVNERSENKEYRILQSVRIEYEKKWNKVFLYHENGKAGKR